MAQFSGKVWVLGDDIDTDIIIPTEYLALETVNDMAKALGIKCVIAKSFARIFFRNSINNGLLLIENDKLHDDVKEGDSVTVTVNEDIDYNGNKYPIASLPDNLVKIIDAGGLVKPMRKLNGLD